MYLKEIVYGALANVQESHLVERDSEAVGRLEFLGTGNAPWTQPVSPRTSSMAKTPALRRSSGNEPP